MSEPRGKRFSAALERAPSRALERRIAAWSWATARWLRFASATFARRAIGCAEQILERNGQGTGNNRQRRDLNAPASDFVRLIGLLRDAERCGHLHLGDAARLAELSHAFAQGDKKGAVVVGDR